MVRLRDFHGTSSALREDTRRMHLDRLDDAEAFLAHLQF